jgi:heme ABC exporter ATP-binding subunit CcmA
VPPRADVRIRLDAVSKLYEGRRALDRIDLDVAQASFVAVMGGNGAGKTTLLRVIAGLSSPTFGTVTVAGVDVRRAGPGLRSLIGYVAHETMLYGDLTAAENLRFHARLFGLRDPDRAVREAAERVDVAHALDRTVRTLSRGTRQRVALARAFVHEPWILLLDEPYTGLDEAASDALRAILADLAAEGRTILVALHEVDRALSGPERLLVLDGGRVALDRPIGDGSDVDATYRTLLHAGAGR